MEFCYFHILISSSMFVEKERTFRPKAGVGRLVINRTDFASFDPEETLNRGSKSVGSSLKSGHLK
jgi:hypothetical protein